MVMEKLNFPDISLEVDLKMVKNMEKESRL
jgi:hypothetical protein